MYVLLRLVTLIGITSMMDIDREFFDSVPTPEPPVPVPTPNPPAPGPDLSPIDSHMLNVINQTRAAFGVQPFVWDNRLAEVGRDAVRHNWAYHENFDGRLARQGLDLDNCAEGSFPAQGQDSSIEGLMTSMLSERRRNGAHAQHFKYPGFTRVGVAYGGRADPDQPFFVIVYSK